MKDWKKIQNDKDEKFSKFIGSRINTISLGSFSEPDEEEPPIQGNTYLRIDTDRGEFNFCVVGDCCSNSWIEHITGVKNVIGGVITENPIQRNGEISREENIGEYEQVLETYQTKFKTDKGELFIEYRNLSNGYYGGWIQFDGDQYDNPVSPHNLNILKDDF